MYPGTVLISILILCVTTGNEALKCIVCDSAASHEKCFEEGGIADCLDNEGSCHSQVRIYEGRTYITKRCKQTLACMNNEIQNDRPAWYPVQCNEGKKNSVCHCCCNTDLCNRNDKCVEEEVVQPTLEVRSSQCIRPDTPIDGSVFCTDDDDRPMLGTICEFACNSGFTLVGRSETTCVENGPNVEFDIASSPQCIPTTCPASLPPLSIGFWESCTNGVQIDSTCLISCPGGTVPARPRYETRCQDDRTWSTSTTDKPHCEAISCKALPPTSGIVMECTGTNYGDTCIFACETGFRIQGRNRFITCTGDGDSSTGIWRGQVPTCRKNICEEKTKVTNGDAINCTGDQVGDTCVISCDTGYQWLGNPDAICTDTGLGDEPVFVPSSAACAVIKCNALQAALGPNLLVDSCTLGVDYGSECSVKCSAGYLLDGDRSITCREDGLWSFFTGYCEEIICLPIGGLEHGSTSCITKDSPQRITVGDQCMFACDANFYMVGSSTTRCEAGTTIVGLWSNPKPACEPKTCTEVSSADYNCTNGHFVGSECTHRPCPHGQYLRGDASKTCIDVGDEKTGVWNVGEYATCEDIRCELPTSIPRGSVRCNGDEVGRSCSFICHEGYAFESGDAVEVAFCEGTGEGNDRSGRWSKNISSCRPIQCQSPGDLEFGKITCSRNNFFTSVCEFNCEEGYILYPNTTTDAICNANRRWSQPLPCCTRSCPPYAKMDIIIIVDSSSSVGIDNWGMMIKFVVGFIEQFELSENYTKVGIFRYNRVVDTNTEVLLGDYRNKNDLLDHIQNNIPYDGSGTFTREALIHAKNAFRDRERNRPGVKDVAFLITDGAPSTDPTEAAKDLRDDGVVIKILPIVRERRSSNPRMVSTLIDDMREIAGDEGTVFASENVGFDHLTKSFAADIGKLVCGEPCRQRKQYSE